MSKFKFVLPLVAAAALACTFAVQAASERGQASAGTLAMVSVTTAGSACRPAGACAARGADQAGVSTSSEPSSYALMAAGLGVIGFIASRRRQQF